MSTPTTSSSVKNSTILRVDTLELIQGIPAKKKPAPAAEGSSSSEDDLCYIEAAPMEAENFYEDGRIFVKQNIYQEEEEEEVEVEEENTCWFRFKTGFRALWKTRTMEGTETGNDQYYELVIRELITYSVFLAFLGVLAFGMVTINDYYFTTAMNNIFLNTAAADETTFLTVSNVNQFWSYMREPLLKSLYWETLYNGSQVDVPNMIELQTKALGVARIRQVKVRNDSCDIPSDFQDQINECYTMYAEVVEDKAPFGPGNGTAWNYTTQKELKSLQTTGIMATYGGGGYYTDLTRSNDSSFAIIDDLYRNLWIRRGSRAVIIDFTVYNGNINLFCVIKLVFEMPATGGVLPYYELKTLKLIRYVTVRDYVVLICEILFMVFIVYYMVEEALEIKRCGIRYFVSFWNWLDIIIILLSIVCSVFNVYRNMAVKDLLEDLLQDETIYANFEFLGYWSLQFNQAIGWTVFLAWIKVFKYISFNKTMSQLSETLTRCAKDLVGFGIMFCIIFLGFAQLGYLIFGSQVPDFRAFEIVLYALFRIILGDFDFQALQTADRVVGPLYFMFYVFFVFFVLINMFIAIINDTYVEIKAEMREETGQYQMTDYFKKKAGKILDKLNLQPDKIVGIRQALEKAKLLGSKTIDFESWRNALRTQGYADGEIEAMFSRYDLNGDRVLRETEIKALLKDLSGGKSKPIEEEKAEEVEEEEEEEDEDPLRGRNEVSQGEFNVLSGRINRMETAMNSVVSKIDAIVKKMLQIDVKQFDPKEEFERMVSTLSLVERMSEEERRKQIKELLEEEDPLSRPATAKSRPASAIKSRPPTAVKMSRPATAAKSRPSTAAKNE